MLLSRLISRLIGTTVLTRTRLGFSVGLIVLLTIIGNEAFQRVNFLRNNLELICISLALTGLAIWILGQFIDPNKEAEGLAAEAPLQSEAGEPTTEAFPQPLSQVAPAAGGFGEGLLEPFPQLSPDENSEDTAFIDKSCEYNPFELFKHLQVWGIVIVMSTCLVFFIALLFHKAPKAKIAPPPPLKIVVKVVTNTVIPVVTNVAAPAVVFPKMKLQGLVYNGDKSTATIDGYAVGVGEWIGEVQVVAIELDRVIIEKQGQQKLLFLVNRRWLPTVFGISKKSPPDGS